MIWFLRVLFAVVIASMLAVTSWASMHTPLFAIPRAVFTHPWFIAIIALGNIAMAAYFLRELFHVPADGPLDLVFTRRNPGAFVLPGALAAASVAVYLLA